MDGRIVFFLSVCVVGLTVGATASGTPSPAVGSIPITENHEANTTLSPNDGYRAGEDNTTAKQSIADSHPQDTPTPSVREPVLSTGESGIGEGLSPSPNHNTSPTTDSTTRKYVYTETTAKVTEQEPGINKHKSAKDATAKTTADLVQEDLDWLRKTFSDTNTDDSLEGKAGEQQTAKPHTETPTTHENRERQGKFDLPPPDKFYEWLNSMQPTQKSRKTEPSRSPVSADHAVLLTNKLVLFVSIFAGVLVLFVTVISAYIICRRKGSKKAPEVDEKPVKPDSEVYFSGYTDVFHGIPTNNDIWKNLDLLTVNAPSVLPDYDGKV